MTKKEFKNKVFSLSERIYPMVARLLGKSQAEDAIQDIMIKLWKKRFSISNHPNLKGFIFLTARNYCLDNLRKRKNTITYHSNNLKVIPFVKEEATMEWNELNSIIKKILQKLPKQQKEVFEMRALDGFKTQEIADTLQIKKEHVRVLLSRARKQIGIDLETNYKYERGVY